MSDPQNPRRLPRKPGSPSDYMRLQPRKPYTEFDGLEKFDKWFNRVSALVIAGFVGAGLMFAGLIILVILVLVHFHIL